MNNEKKDIPYLSFESALTTLEVINKRMWILCIILIITLLGTNAGWLWYEKQFEDVVITQEAEADGNSNINLQGVGGDYYGRESEADN